MDEINEVSSEAQDTSVDTSSADSSESLGLSDVELAAINAPDEKEPKAKGDTPLNAQAATSATPETPAYTPDFKYKVWGQEKELDPRVRAIIKSKEDEEWIKKQFSAADGVETFKTQAQEARNAQATVMKEVNNVLKAADMGDYKAAFKSMGVDISDIPKVLKGLGYDDRAIIEHAYHLAQLTPEQKAAYAKQDALQRQAQETEMRAQSYETRALQLETRMREQELTQALSHPEIAPIQSAFDQNHGQGAFWEEVKNYGEFVFLKHKKDIPVHEAVVAVARRLSSGVPQVPQQSQSGFRGQPAQATAARSPSELPVIPTMPSGGTNSPTKRAVKSVKDIENEYNSLA